MVRFFVLRAGLKYPDMKNLLFLTLLLGKWPGLQAASISVNLTAEYNRYARQVELKWQNILPDVKAYVLERSSNNQHWEAIYTIRATDFSRKKREKYNDKNPDPTKNYYRLKIITVFDSLFTEPIMVIIGETYNNWTLYPVPVKDVLNLRYNGSEAIQGVVSVFIQNIYGYVFTRKRFSSLSRLLQIPVDNLGKGVYDVRIMIGNEAVWNQRFVK